MLPVALPLFFLFTPGTLASWVVLLLAGDENLNREPPQEWWSYQNLMPGSQVEFHGAGFCFFEVCATLLVLLLFVFLKQPGCIYGWMPTYCKYGNRRSLFAHVFVVGCGWFTCKTDGDQLSTLSTVYPRSQLVPGVDFAWPQQLQSKDSLSGDTCANLPWV